MMLADVKVKCCGLTREEDVDLVLDLGADYCGFIVYPNSPRGLTLERAIQLAARVPESKRVLVDVAPTPDQIARYAASGFARIQLHGRGEETQGEIEGWAPFFWTEAPLVRAASSSG